MGKLIVLDALDGAGKETQSKELVEKMYRKGEDVILIDFPNYGSESSYGVRQVLQSKTDISDPYQVSSLYSTDRLLTMHSRIESLDTTLLQFYNEGGIIICDRYTTSNMLYQTINMTDLEVQKYMEWLKRHEYSYLGLPVPDLILFLDVPPDIAMQNIIARNKGTDAYENEGMLRKVYANIPRLIKDIDNFTRINCTENNKMLTVAEISDRIMQKVEEIL